MRRLGDLNLEPDIRKARVLQRQASVRTTSALDYWDQLVTLHYGTRVAITDHFRGTALGDSWAWAGAPFGAPGATAFDLSLMTVSTITDAFLYQPVINTYDKLCSVALVSNTLDDMAGLRLDDGSDNNYVEVLLRCSQATPTQWTVRARQRAGGGAVTTATGDAMSTPPGFVLRMELAGAGWSAWGFYPVAHTNMGFGGWMYKPQTDLGSAALNWTPTRAGLVFRPASDQIPLKANADWVDLGRA